MTNWYVVHSEPGKEALATAGLVGRQFRPYLPSLGKVVRHGRGKLRTVLRPMFPGYLFLADDFPASRWRSLYSTVGVHTLLRSGGQLAAIPDAAIAAIRAQEAFEAEVAPRRRSWPFHVGDTVRMADDGPWMGLFAHLQDLDDDGRVCLLLDVLGRQTKVFTSADKIAAA